MTNNLFKIIGKYAILLVVFYGLEVLLGLSYKYFLTQTESYNVNTIVMSATTILTYVLNIITAIIINIDRKKFEIEGKYSVLLAIFYRPIGIVLFLIYLIYKNLKEKPAY